MQKGSIKQITFTKLIQIFLIAIAIISLVMFFAYQAFFDYTVKTKALEISNIVKAGLTSHMKAGIMEKREYFLNEIQSTNNIKELNIIRGEAILKQHGTSTYKHEKSYKELKSGGIPLEAQFYWQKEQNTLRAVIPYRASKDGELNCLTCHNVQDGEILGALEISLDVNQYQTLTTTYGFLLIFFLLFFAFLIILYIFHFIGKYISKPLANIAKEAHFAYTSQSKIDAQKYHVDELKSLAADLNNLNQVVFSKEKELEDKNLQLKQLHSEIESTLREIMMTIGEIEEVRSNDVKNHTKRVSLLSATIAKDYGLSEEDVKLIELTSPLHDIGKIGISDAILLKPGKLTKEEFEIMKTHTVIGYNILGHSQRRTLQTAAEIAYGHHEKFDGSGYPQGLKGEEIPLFARIVAIVDVLDALLCKRVYKEAWSTEAVLDYVIKERAKHFDPQLVDIVINNFEKYTTLIECLVDGKSLEKNL